MCHIFGLPSLSMLSMSSQLSLQVLLEMQIHTVKNPVVFLNKSSYPPQDMCTSRHFSCLGLQRSVSSLWVILPCPLHDVLPHFGNSSPIFCPIFLWVLWVCGKKTKKPNHMKGTGRLHKTGNSLWKHTCFQFIWFHFFVGYQCWYHWNGKSVIKLVLC